MRHSFGVGTTFKSANLTADSSTSEGSNASKTLADGQGRLRYAHGEPLWISYLGHKAG
jgi:hypothetical protein